MHLFISLTARFICQLFSSHQSPTATTPQYQAISILIVVETVLLFYGAVEDCYGMRLAARNNMLWSLLRQVLQVHALANSSP